MALFSDMLQPGASVYFVGIKGTGMCALAELMQASNFTVSGSDIAEVFYTDAILQELDIPYYEKFDASHIKKDFAAVIHSAAYSVENNPEIAEALKHSIPVIKYPDALGAWSQSFDSSGIAGVHGKTTTTALAGTLADALELPVQVLVGSAVESFGGRSTLVRGKKYFIAETCEYRKHFLSFRPRRIVLTSVEPDHQDFFPDYASIRDAFVEYCLLLPKGGLLIYCADDPGASEVVKIVQKKRKDIQFLPYGFTAQGPWHIENYRIDNKKALFSVGAFPRTLALQVPGKHEVLDAVAALALCESIAADEAGCSGDTLWDEQRRQSVQKALEGFKGSKRRSEILGETQGILFMDDYGHHPTAIKTTLEGLKTFYPERRIIVSFMSHTYTRTAALLDEFAACFSSADILFLHKIYASARESNDVKITGKTLYEKTSALRPEVYYSDEPMDAFDTLCMMLNEGDLFITMGAGNNWPLGRALYEHFGDTEK